MLCIHVELYHKQGSHSHGKSWKKWSWKVVEKSKNSEFHGNLFIRKKVMEKSWKSVVQIRLICSYCVVINVDLQSWTP